MVDDIAGITEAGIKANQFNSFLNVKTAEKTLQFGNKKCQYMIVGKNGQYVTQKNLKVDHWRMEYKENKMSGEHDMFEYYDGKLDVMKTNQYKYLGFIISNTGDNMANIKAMKNKSIGVIRRILSKLESLKLKYYYFECAVILMNVILRATILYAADMYYALKETEYRQIERIEEDYMRKIMKTTKGCPITNLYLELGHIPARFEIIKMRLLYMKYILEQPEDSTISKMLELQFENPTPGDWASTCLNDLQYIDLNITKEEIRNIPKQNFLKILKEKISTKALDYLLEKRGKKGCEIKYSCFEIAEYLQPYNKLLNIEQQREMF